MHKFPLQPTRHTLRHTATSSLSSLLLLASLSNPNSLPPSPLPSISSFNWTPPVHSPLLLSRLLSSPSSLSPPAFLSLLNSLIRTSNFDSALRLLSAPLPFSLSVSALSSLILSSLGAAKPHLPLALCIFRLIIESSPDVVPSVRAANYLLLAVSRVGSVPVFLEVFESLERRNLEFSVYTYNICIGAFSRFGRRFLPVCMSLFEKMRRADPPVCADVCTYNSLIRVLCVNGKVKDAFMVFSDMKDFGHEPDLCSYRPLIQVCCKTYLVDKALNLFDELEKNGIRADTIVYNSLLDGLLKARKLDDACKLFDKMVTEGIKASVYSFNILIHGLFRNNRPVAGFVLFCELKKKKGSFVDGISFSIVINELCKEGRVEEALELVGEMNERGFVVDLVTISSLLIGFYKFGRLDLAEGLMKYVRDTSFVLSVFRWKENLENLLKRPQDKGKDFTPLFRFDGNFDYLSSLIKGKDLDFGDVSNQEEEIKDEWSPSPYLDKLAKNSNSFDNSKNEFVLSKGKRVQGFGNKTFDLDMVNTYLSIFISKGKLSVACKLFEIFTTLATKEEANSYTYNSLMSIFVKKGYLTQVWGVLNEMGEKSCKKDIATYNLIIQGLSKMGKAELVNSVIEKLNKKGGYLDIVMYNTLINAFGKEGRLNEANKLFHQMMKSGINPDLVTFNTLIEIHAKAGRVKDAYKFLRKMLSLGLSPNHVTDTILESLEKEIEKQKQKEKEELNNS